MKKGEKPTVEQLEAALHSAKKSGNYHRALRSTIYALLVVAAAAILVATLVMPILQISGSSMTPVIGDGEIAAVLKTDKLVIY